MPAAAAAHRAGHPYWLRIDYEAETPSHCCQWKCIALGKCMGGLICLMAGGLTCREMCHVRDLRNSCAFNFDDEKDKMTFEWTLLPMSHLRSFLTECIRNHSSIFYVDEEGLSKVNQNRSGHRPNTHDIMSYFTSTWWPHITGQARWYIVYSLDWISEFL